MKRTILMLFCCGILFNHGIAQSISQKVLPSAGGYYHDSKLDISYTIGETITPTLIVDKLMLTQGFQQPLNSNCVFQVNGGLDTISVCGDSALLYAPSGYNNYLWTGVKSSSIIYASSTGWYFCIVNGNACVGTDSVYVSILKAEILQTDTTICNGSKINLNLKNSLYNKHWSTGDTTSGITIQPSQTITYYVSVSNGSSSCMDSVKIQVIGSDTPAATLAIPIITALCPGSTIRLKASGGNSYNWYLNNVKIAGANLDTYEAYQIGTYSVKANLSSNCTTPVSNTIELTNIKKPKVSFTFDSFCSGKAINFVNTSNENDVGTIYWSWAFGDNIISNLKSPSHIYIGSSSKTVQLIGVPANCLQLADTAVQVINIESSGSSKRYETLRAVLNKSYTLTARDIGTVYKWYPSTDLTNPNIRTPQFVPKDNREYLIEIYSRSGCIVTDTLKVEIFKESAVYVPKGFTPNKNIINDLLRPILVNVPTIHYFRIYNRWAQLIYQTNKKQEGWDGVFNGQKQPTETYTWTFEGMDVDNKMIKSSGKTVLIR